MLIKVNKELWIDTDFVVKASLEDDEFKYTMDFKDKMITYITTKEIGMAFLGVLEVNTLKTKGNKA